MGSQKFKLLFPNFRKMGSVFSPRLCIFETNYPTRRFSNKLKVMAPGALSSAPLPSGTTPLIFTKTCIAKNMRERLTMFRKQAGSFFWTPFMYRLLITGCCWVTSVRISVCARFTDTVEYYLFIYLLHGLLRTFKFITFYLWQRSCLPLYLFILSVSKIEKRQV